MKGVPVIGTGALSALILCPRLASASTLAIIRSFLLLRDLGVQPLFRPDFYCFGAVPEEGANAALLSPRFGPS